MENDAQESTAETAFLVVCELDGTYRASTDLSEILLVNRYATIQDIRQASRDILDKINEDLLADAVAARIARLSVGDSEKVAASIREALDKRTKE